MISGADARTAEIEIIRLGHVRYFHIRYVLGTASITVQCC